MSRPHEEQLKSRGGKRTPSILVTDSRTSNTNTASSPFVRTTPLPKRQQHPNNDNVSGFQQYPPRNVNRRSKFANISVSGILSLNSSSGRAPPLLSNTSNGTSILPLYSSTPSTDMSTSGASISRSEGTKLKSRLSNRLPSTRLSYTKSDSGSSNTGVLKTPMPKLIQPLPARTSKTSQKLVYIPEEDNSEEQVKFKHADTADDACLASPAAELTTNGSALSGSVMTASTASDTTSDSRKSIRKVTAEIKSLSAKNRDDLARVTAYFISEAVDLDNAAQFLKTNHKVSTRLYDEVLYVPYQLPLLDGINGYRVRSGIYTKNSKGKSKLEDSINNTESKDYHFEYYAGQDEKNSKKRHEEDTNMVNNTADDKNLESHNGREDAVNKKNRKTVTFSDDFLNKDDMFDPHEPQYFTMASSLTTTNTIDAINNPNLNSEVKQDSGLLSGSISNVPVAQSSDRGEVYLFNYGVIVFWNFTKIQEENILADLAFSRSKPSSLMMTNDDYDEDENYILINEINEQEIETEEFHFEYDKNTNVPRIYNDLITLKSEDHLIKMSLSHAIAQSTKLSRFESRMSTILYSVSKLPKILALTGELGLTREKLLRKSGKLFKLRVDVNLSSNVLDTPEFFWSFEPSLNPLYSAAREYLEIDERVMVINDRCKVFLEFTDVIAESIAENNMTKITWIIIIIIMISLIISCMEIFIRYSILSRHK